MARTDTEIQRAVSDAERAARNAPGITDVENKLAIDPSEIRSALSAPIRRIR